MEMDKIALAAIAKADKLTFSRSAEGVCTIAAEVKPTERNPFGGKNEMTVENENGSKGFASVVFESAKVQNGLQSALGQIYKGDTVKLQFDKSEGMECLSLIVYRKHVKATNPTRYEFLLRCWTVKAGK